MASKKPYSLQTYISWGSFGFLAGVLLHAITPLSGVAVWIPLAILVVGFVIPHRIAMIVMIACAIGLWRFDVTLPNDADDLGRMKGETIVMTGRVESVRSYNAVLDVHTADGAAVRSRSYVSFSSQGRWIAVGEEWRVTCRLEQNEKTEMRYQLWDARKGIFYTCKGSTSLKHLAYAKPWDVKAALARWRELMSRRIALILPGDEGALLAGILYGERGLSKEANEAFRFAGMTHLIAVSGSNITLVVSLFVPFLVFIGYRRKSAIVLSGAGILLFTLFVGAEASVVRAAIMGWLAILARAFGRKPNVTHLLLLAGTVMILFDPWALGFDAGFALSFLATWGLIAWSGPITKMIRWVPNVLSIREIIATTTAATFVTAPYLLWAFEEMSLAGLVTNLAAIPLVGFAMAWGAAAAALGSWIPQIAFPAIGSLRLMLAIADLSQAAPFLKVACSLPTCGLFVSYAAMFFIWMLHKAKMRDYPQKDEEKLESAKVIRSFVRPC
jgi:ComEC/Rec2-related protein